MATTHHVVAGQTSPYDIDLKDDGAIPSGTLGGTVTLVLETLAGVVQTLTGTVSIQDATNWRVRISPAAGDFVEGIYQGRIRVVDSSGKIAYFPNSARDKWIVHGD